MTPVHAEHHELVDRLTPAQADAVREIVRHLLQAAGPNAVEPDGEPQTGGRGRRLFAGALRSGRAARSEDSTPAEPARAGNPPGHQR